ncbi:MAG: alanine--tRNA ligase-related protein, partial [Planctomycetota bacterium]
FVGYEKLETESIVKGIIIGKEPVEYIDNSAVQFIVILDPTPFYGEEGGQVGDTGKIISEYAEVDVLDTKKDEELIYSICKLARGKISLYDRVKAVVNVERRFNTARNHTGTHILHSALRLILGPHVQQAGSLVAPYKLRFDFTHPTKLSLEEMELIESFVNKKILENHTVCISEKELEEAKKEGALAFFGEKYKNRVRVVTIGDFSKELCGGTHLTQTGLVGFIKLTDESSIASGIRRLEAVTGEEAIKMAQDDIKIVKKLSNLLQVPRDRILEKIDSLLESVNSLRKELSKHKIKEMRSEWDKILSDKENVIKAKNLSFVVLECDEVEKEVINTAFELIEEYELDLLLIVSTQPPYRIVLLKNKKLKEQFHAGRILKDFLYRCGCAGGGSDSLAQGTLKDVKISDIPPLFLNFLNEYYQ